MSVYKPAKSRFYQYDFRRQGRRFHGSTGVETRRKAEAVERRLRERLAAGESLDAGLTLDEAAGRWWTEVGRHLATRIDVERRINICLRLIGPGRPLTEISTSALSRAIERRRAETFTKGPDKPATARQPARAAARYPVANATVNADIVGIMRRILRRARTTWETRGLPEIDWRALTLREPAPAVQYYTRAQREAWAAQCDSTARFALTLLLTYGPRFNELFFPPSAFDPGLGRGEPDADGQATAAPCLVLAKRKGDVPHVIELRADDAREIAARAGRAMAAGLPSIWFEQQAVPPALAKVDRATRRAAAETAGQILTPVTYYGLQARLKSAARRAGLDGGRLIHGARHHAGTETLRRSGNLKLTQQLLGHKDITSTLRYAHALQGDLRALVESERRNSPEPGSVAAPDFVVPQRRRRGGPDRS